MTLILVVDDEHHYLDILQLNLESEGFSVVTADSGEEALELFSKRNPDLVLLDIIMPGIDGFAVCERIRQISSTPIIFLTARGEEQDRVDGLNIGADDYISKPFSVVEVIARVHAVLRRTQTSEQTIPNRHFMHGNLKIDFARAEVWIDNSPINLSSTEYRLLIHFASNVGRILTAEDLLDAVWGPQYKTEKEILWVSIARLRQKLEVEGHDPKHIVTRTGKGYFMPSDG